MPNQRRNRRPRPRIDYTSFVGSGTTISTPITTVTLLTEPSQIAEQLHVEELQVAGVYQMESAGVTGIATVSMVPEKTGTTSAFEDSGVRNRFIMGNDVGVPFVVVFKNMNLGAGVALRFEITPRVESSDAVHSVIVMTKVVFRELG